jgi:Cu(I)/Ag(I) efflux system membrane fusion protein/cobalt-zinc-cadmium efflux system membrane fusion protein
MSVRNKGRLKSILGWTVAAVVGYLAATFLPSDFLGFIKGRSDPSDIVSSEGAADEQLYTCGMHPHVLEHGPGECPICGMSMVPVGTSTIAGDRAGEILFYRNPMDPTITSPVPRQDEMGMEYVPVYAEDASRQNDAKGVIRIDPAVVQNMNVQSALVERRNLRHPIRTVGYLDYDQERMVTVTTKYSGWVEKVYINYIGQPVKRGQPLFEVYSPELVQTQQELLSAINFAHELGSASGDTRRRAESLVESARTRLSYWDISPDQIAKLHETGEVFRTLTVVAPSNGLVMKRMASLEGMAIRPGMEIFHIADLSSLWLSVEIFEDQVAWVREGTPAEIQFTYFPGKTFRGSVQFIEPQFSEQTRTLSVKIEVPNPTGQLRKGMFATVGFEPIVVEGAIVVPAEAVLRTGQRSVVILAQGEGRFMPREVVIGHSTEGFLEILEGLDEGEEVVTSSQFLLDSESKLREAIQKMIDSASGGDSTNNSATMPGAGPEGQGG